jgi:cytochrome c
MASGRSFGRGATSIACLILLAGCRDAPGPAADGASAGAGSDGAMSRGELLSLACQACHTLGAGEPDRIGPNLHGVFGRTAGMRPGFAYSDALRRSGIVWTPATLERWMAAPDAFLPGTTMVFAGYADPADRRALLEYLTAATAGDPAP